MQFLAARSLWTNFLALRYAMPSAISAAIWIISFSVGGGRPEGLFCKNQCTKGSLKISQGHVERSEVIQTRNQVIKKQEEKKPRIQFMF